MCESNPPVDTGLGIYLLNGMTKTWFEKPVLKLIIFFLEKSDLVFLEKVKTFYVLTFVLMCSRNNVTLGHYFQHGEDYITNFMCNVKITTIDPKLF